MAKEFILNNTEEFQEMIDKKDFKISEAVVETILENLNSRKKHIHVLSINCLEENVIYDITLEKRFFAETLKDNLGFFVEREQYEKCTQIVEAIDKLNQKSKPQNGSKSIDKQS